MRFIILTALLLPALFFISCSGVSEEEKSKANLFLQKSDNYIHSILEADSLFVLAIHKMVNNGDSVNKKGEVKNTNSTIDIDKQYTHLKSVFTVQRDSLMTLLNQSKQYEISNELELFCKEYEKILNQQYASINDRLIQASKSKKKKKISIELILDDSYTADSILNVRLKALNAKAKVFKDKYR